MNLPDDLLSRLAFNEHGLIPAIVPDRSGCLTGIAAGAVGAIEERLSRLGPRAKTTRQEAIQTFFDAAGRSKIHDRRSPEDIIGFDEFGLPT